MHITPMALSQLQRPKTAPDTAKATNKSKTEPAKRRPSFRQRLRLSSLGSSSPRLSSDSTETLTSMCENDSQRLSQEHDSCHEAEDKSERLDDHRPRTPPSHVRATSDPTPIPILQRWDGIQRAASEWNCLHKDPDLWHEHGNCAIFLYRPGQSQRGPSFRLPYSLLLDCRCTPLLETSLVSTNTGSPWRSHRESNSGEFFLYLYAPSELNKIEAFAYHVTTRNFVAWVLGRPLVGVDPITAILELKKRMDIWRDTGLDNFRTLLKFTRSQGYADARSSSAYFRPASWVKSAETFRHNLGEQARQQSEENKKVASGKEANDGVTIKSPSLTFLEDGSPPQPSPVPRRFSLTAIPEKPVSETQKIHHSPAPNVHDDTPKNTPRQADMRYVPQRPAPHPPRAKLAISPPNSISPKHRPRATNPSMTSGPISPLTASSPRSIPELDGGRSSPGSETDTSDSLRSSIQTPMPDEIQAFDFGFGLEMADKEMIDEVIAVWEKSATADEKRVGGKREKKKGLLGWGRGVVGKVGDRWEGGKDTVEWMQRGVNGGDDLRDMVQGLAGKG